MNKKPRTYTEFVGFKTTKEVKELFLKASALDKEYFTHNLKKFCLAVIKHKAGEIKMRKANLADALKQTEQTKHYIIEKASIDPIFLKDNENFRNLKFNVAISIWFEEECSFKPMKEGGFILHKPSGDLIFTQEEWSDLCRKITVWFWGDNIYCNSEEMKQKLINYGFITYNS